MASQRWLIDSKTRDEAVKAAKDIINSSESTAKAKTDAIKALANLDKLNVEEDKLHTPQLLIHADLNKMSDEQLTVRIEELEKLLKDQRDRELALSASNLSASKDEDIIDTTASVLEEDEDEDI